MSFRDSWRKLNNFSIAERLFPDYIIDKNIFRFALVISVLLLIAILSNYGFDLDIKYYVSCPVDNPTPCINPFYNDDGLASCPMVGLCDFPFLDQGDSFGEKPPFVVRMFPFLMFFIFGSAILINHIKYNWRVKT